MNKSFYALLLLFGWPIFALTQNPNDFAAEIDSLSKLINKENNDTLLVHHYMHLSTAYFNIRNLDSCLAVAQRGYHLAQNGFSTARIEAKKKSFRQSQALLCVYLGNIYSNTNQRDSVEFYYHESIRLYEELGDEIGKTTALGSIAQYYSVIGLTDESIKLLNEVAEIQLSLNDQEGLGTTLMRMGYFYRKRGNTQEAVKYLEKSVKIIELQGASESLILAYNETGLAYEQAANYSAALDYFYKALNTTQQMDYKRGMGMSLNNIGMFYSHQGDYEKSLEFLEEGLAINLELNEEMGTAAISNNLGEAYSNLNRTNESIESFKRALKIYENRNRQNDIARIKTNMGYLYLQLDSLATASDLFADAFKIGHETKNDLLVGNALTAQALIDKLNHNYPAGISKGNAAFELMETQGDLKGMMQAEEVLGDLYSLSGNWKEAYTHYKRFVILKDSVIDIEAQRDAIVRDAQNQIERAAEENRYNLLEKEKEILANEARINDLKKGRTIKNRTITGITLCSILLAVVGLLWFRNYNQKRDFKEREITKQLHLYMKEIDLLQATIQSKKVTRVPQDIEIVKGDINQFLVTPLSSREMEVLLELTKGKDNQQIADSLYVSINTVRTHLSKIYEKLDVKNRLQAVNKMTNLQQMK